MQRVLVLSGGGALGAFQLGAMLYIDQEVKRKVSGYRFDLVSGVSVGALNGALWAGKQLNALEKVWRSSNLERIVFQGKLEWMSIARRLLASEKSLLDNEPLFQLIQRYVHRERMLDSDVRFRMGAVSLRTGKLHTLGPADFPTEDDFQKFLLASTSIPILWPPVPEINTRHGKLYDLVDGSLRDTSPLGDVVHEEPDEVVVINCASRNMEIPVDEQAGKNIFTIAKRALVDIAVNEIFENDLREFLQINDLVEQVARHAPEMGLWHTRRGSNEKSMLKQFRTILIEPEGDLGSLLDFSEDAIQMRIEAGFHAASRVYQKMFTEIQS